MREKKIVALELMKKSTAHDWRHRYTRMYTLCVWAAWHHARKNGDEIPTYDSIWGSTDFKAHVYQDVRSKEVIVAAEAPRHGKWTRIGSATLSTRATTLNLNSGIETTGLAVDQLFKIELSPRERVTLLHIFPVVGKYQGVFWEDKHLPLGEQSFWGQDLPLEEGENVAAGEVLNDEISLRDIDRSVSSSEMEIIRNLNRIYNLKTVRKAVKILEEERAFAPRERQIQPDLEFPLSGKKAG